MPTSTDKTLIGRPPVVVIMGHIDHGKSTLLDYIRKANVTAGEAGGITQHVGAYQAEYVAADKAKHVITFLDTPGHEAFCTIRERGARAADVAILVVSAEDGVKPQTIEAYKNIQEQQMPYIVAITKIDKPNANVTQAKQSLGENEIYVEGWGGDIPCVELSGTTGQGVPDLLEMILLVTQIADHKTTPAAPAEGMVIESTLDTRKGVSATLLVQDGTLHTGEFVVAGDAYAPVRFIEDFAGAKVESATASMPVRILGWSAIPACGTLFEVVTSKRQAEDLVDENVAEMKALKEKAATSPAVSSAGSSEGTAAPAITVPVVIKADVIGSLEGVRFELQKIRNDKVRLKIVSEGIGEINENDVKLAQGDPTIMLLGFNVMPDKKSAAVIERSAVPLNVATFKIIYDLKKFVENAVLSKVPKEYVEEVTGRAKVLAVFSKDKDRQVVGGKVETGTLESGAEVRITRRDTEIGRGKIRELQAKKQRTDEVAEGHECGMLVEAKVEIAAGDRIEAVRTVEKK